MVETVLLSLRLSCRSELTRQGTSLSMLLPMNFKLFEVRTWKVLALLTGSSQDPNLTCCNESYETLVTSAGLVIQLDPMNKLRNMHACFRRNKHCEQEIYAHYRRNNISVALCMSPCSSDYIFNSFSTKSVTSWSLWKRDALRLVSEDPINVSCDKSQPMKWFPADCLHRTDFYFSISEFLRIQLRN